MRSLIFWAVALTVSACDQPQIKVRRVVEPAQRTLSQLLVRRVLNGASGPSWLVTPFHVLVAHPTCMLRRGETGAIWRLYDSPDSTGTDAGRSYDALAEVITRDSLRYHVSIQAPSAALRDSLAGEVSRAIIGST